MRGRPRCGDRWRWTRLHPMKGKEVDTGLRKLGVVMGDDVKTGINASIDVGTVIGEGTFIGMGAVARGTIAAGSRIH